MKHLPPLLAIVPFLAFISPPPASAWDYEGHRTVNQLALGSLPDDFPAFVRTPAARERIAFLGGEADRWRNVGDLALRHENGPDHYIDLEQLDEYGLKADALPVFRYMFVGQLASARAAHPEKFAPLDATRNEDHTRELVGFLPWTIAEYYGKLKSGFAYLKALQNAGTPEEIANAQENLIYVMGVMGHFPADAAQPLHTTIHHHGWVGANPHGFTTDTTFHAWIDGGYFFKTGGLNAQKLRPKVTPAKLLEDTGKAEQIFKAALAFIEESQKQVEPLYQLQKDGKLSGEGEKGLEGRVFLEGQLVKGADFLGSLWLSAWKHAPEDRYLKEQLAKRKLAASEAR